MRRRAQTPLHPAGWGLRATSVCSSITSINGTSVWRLLEERHPNTGDKDSARRTCPSAGLSPQSSPPVDVPAPQTEQDLGWPPGGTRGAHSATSPPRTLPSSVRGWEPHGGRGNPSGDTAPGWGNPATKVKSDRREKRRLFLRRDLRMAMPLSLLLPCCPAWDWERRNWGTDCMWPGSNTSCCRVWRELISYGKSKQQSSEMSVLCTASPLCEVPHYPILYAVLDPIHSSHSIAGTSHMCPSCTGELQVQSCSRI